MALLKVGGNVTLLSAHLCQEPGDETVAAHGIMAGDGAGGMGCFDAAHVCSSCILVAVSFRRACISPTNLSSCSFASFALFASLASLASFSAASPAGFAATGVAAAGAAVAAFAAAGVAAAGAVVAAFAAAAAAATGFASFASFASLEGAETTGAGPLEGAEGADPGLVAAPGIIALDRGRVLGAPPRPRVFTSMVASFSTPQLESVASPSSCLLW